MFTQIVFVLSIKPTSLTPNADSIDFWVQFQRINHNDTNQSIVQMVKMQLDPMPFLAKHLYYPQSYLYNHPKD